MEHIVSKSKFKPQALKSFRQLEARSIGRSQKGEGQTALASGKYPARHPWLPPEGILIEIGRNLPVGRKIEDIGINNFPL